MTIRYPKNFNRRMLIKQNTADAEYMLIAVGIQSRSNSITENTEKYAYMDGRGTSETDVISQDIAIAFTGHRAIGDAAQDYILDKVLYEIDRREVEYIDYDDGIDISKPENKTNGWAGKAAIQITDFGSGDSGARQSVGFTLSLTGKPVRGKVTFDTAANKYTWTPETPAPAE